VNETIEAMKNQWKSMASMGGMFIITIFLGITIQPIYNKDIHRGFGEEGTTQAGFILLELMLIGIFTFAIIWLARKGLDYLIKGFIMFTLFWSLTYMVWPYTALILQLTVGSQAYSMEIALLINAVLMITLWKFPEWYVVNLVGILVGSSVIVMLGITFVPTLIIIFMILAAIYDHWAVNGSKHMLELADTMIDLKLPILLVAPKDKNYSYINEGGDIMKKPVTEKTVQIPSEEDWNNPKIDLEAAPKGGRDALMMGLGDVIFPGMLVISAISFLPQTGIIIGSLPLSAFFGWIHLDPLLVGLGTLLGGFMGYLGLMTQVAKGKPQAGLPLLNGGAILGYLISIFIVFGPSELIQEISLF
jgi:presenilin-like A22 family membrane protease